jgi:uncharacterized membrane protein YeiB
LRLALEGNGVAAVIAAVALVVLLASVIVSYLWFRTEHGPLPLIMRLFGVRLEKKK